jgi:hypothetical protein
MRVDTEIITPEMAAHYLLSNTNNRPCTPRRVADLAGAMKRGEWVMNGDSIRFSEEGVLLDGQGRLKACVSSGVSFVSLVVRGLPGKSFQTIDMGKKRTMGEILSLEGERNSNKLARALRFLLMYEDGSYNGKTYTPQQLRDCLHRHHGIRTWMSNQSLYKVTPHAAVVLTVCYIGSLTRPNASEEFMVALADGVLLDKGSPVLALRERLQRDRVASSRTHPSYVSQLIIHAYNAFVNGDKRWILKGDRNALDLPRIQA